MATMNCQLTAASIFSSFNSPIQKSFILCTDFGGSVDYLNLFVIFSRGNYSFS